jgi:hypothetical protein
MFNNLAAIWALAETELEAATGPATAAGLIEAVGRMGSTKTRVLYSLIRFYLSKKKST